MFTNQINDFRNPAGESIYTIDLISSPCNPFLVSQKLISNNNDFRRCYLRKHFVTHLFILNLLTYFSACNRTLIADVREKYFTSPNYPNSYPANSNCEWNIVNYHRNGRLLLHITDFVTENNYDFVYIYSDGHYRGKLTGILSNASRSFFANRHMRVVFTSDHSGQRKGFKAYYGVRGNYFVLARTYFSFVD